MNNFYRFCLERFHNVYAGPPKAMNLSRLWLPFFCGFFLFLFGQNYMYGQAPSPPNVTGATGCNPASVALNANFGAQPGDVIRWYQAGQQTNPNDPTATPITYNFTGPATVCGTPLCVVPSWPPAVFPATAYARLGSPMPPPPGAFVGTQTNQNPPFMTTDVFIGYAPPGTANPTKTGINGFNASPTYYAKFEMGVLSNPGNLHSATWKFALGAGPNFGNNPNEVTDNETFAKINFNFINISSTVDIIAFNGATGVNIGSVNNLAPSPKIIEVYANASAQNRIYQRGALQFYLPANTYDIWIDGVLAANDFAKVSADPALTSINSLAFTGSNENPGALNPGDGSVLFLDNIDYNILDTRVVLHTGFTYTTPVLNATTTYYAAVHRNDFPYNLTTSGQYDGVMGRTPVVATINNPPNAAVTPSQTTICAVSGNTVVSFSGTADPGSTFAWNCDGCTSGSLSGVGPHTLTWNTGGTKTVTLTVSTPSCPSSSTTVLITVNQHASSFTTSGSPWCVNTNTTLAFNGQAVGSTTYTWNCDGCSGLANPNAVGPHTVSWSTSGNKSITLTLATPACPTLTTTVFVNVNEHLAAFLANPNPACINTNVNLQFSGVSSAGTTYSWNCDGCSNLLNPNFQGPHTVSWFSSGTKTVTLTLNTPGCPTASTTTLVTVNNHSAVINPSDNPGCLNANNTLTFTGINTPTTSYNWSCDGCSGLIAPNAIGPHTVSWSSIGTKTVTLSVNTPGCPAASTTVLVTINQQSPSFIASSNPICVGSNISLTSSSVITTGLTTFNWNCDGCSGLSNPNGQGPHSVAWNSSGTKTVTLTLNTPGCGNQTVTTLVTVNDQPTATFNASNSNVCENANVTLTFSGVAGNAYFWNCDGCSGGNPTTQGPHTVSWNAFGVKTVALTVSAPGCANATATHTITVNQAPVAAMNVSQNPICVNTNAILTFTGSASALATYLWNCDGCAGLGGGAGPHTVSWSFPGVKTISLTVNSPSCPSSATTTTVTVNQHSASFTATPQELCINQNVNLQFNGVSATGTTYNWNCAGCVGLLAPTSSGPHTVSWGTPGVKTVSLTINTPGCPADIATVLVTINTTPTSAFNLSQQLSCVNSATVATHSGIPGSVYTWNCGGCSSGLLNGPGPHSLSWSTPGTKTITLQVGATGCAPSAITTILATINQHSASFNASHNPICLDQNTTLTFNGLNTAGITTYNWNCDGCSNLAAPGAIGPHTVSWVSQGQKTVTLTLTTPGCPNSTASQVITVNQHTPSFNVSQNQICVGSSVSFVASGINMPSTAYNWNCDGCNNLLAPNAPGPHTVTWATPGVKTVSLTVVTPGCPTATHTVNVTVNATPTSNFSVDNSQTCINSLLTATHIGAPGNFYSWNCDGCNGGNPTTQGPHSLSWSTTGVKTLTLLVSANGCPAPPAFTVLVTVNQHSSAVGIAGGPFCQGTAATLSFTGTSSSGSTYNWACDGCSGLTNPSGQGPHTVTWGAAGVKTVSLTVSTPGCIPATATQTVTVWQPPIADFNVSNQQHCTGQNNTLTFTGTPGQNYAWNCNGCSGIAATVGPHTVSWLSGGTKTITLTVSSPGCPSSTQTAFVTVYQQPSASLIASNNLICVAQSTTLTNIGVGGTSFNWICDGCDGAPPATAGPHSLSWSFPGVKTVQLTVNAPTCPSATATSVITVNQHLAQFSASANPVCANSNTVLNFEGLQSSSTTFTWNCNGCSGLTAPASQGPHTVSWSTSGQKTVTLTLSTPGCPASAATSVVTVTQQSANFTASANPVCVESPTTLTFAGTPNSGISYSWSCDGCSGIANPTTSGPHTVSWLTPGNKTVTLAVTSPGCPTATVTQTITVNQHMNAFTIAPNPVCANSVSNLSFSGMASPGTNFNWNCGGCAGLAQVTSSGPHAVSWNVEGVKTVTLNLTTPGCGSATVTALVTVNHHNAAFSTSSNPVCLNSSSTLTFSGNASGTTTYNWNCDGCLGIANNATSGPHTVSWASAGTKSVTLTLTTPGCGQSVNTQVVTVNQQQVAFSISETQLCVGSSTQLNFSGIASPGAAFSWSCDGCVGLSAPTSSGPHAVSWSTAGVKTIALQVNTPGCAPQTVTQTLTVYAAPTSNFSVSSNQGCLGSSLTLTHLGVLATHYTWNCDGCNQSLTTAGPHTVFWNTTGVKTLTLQVSSPGCPLPALTSVLVTINQHQANFSVAANPICIGQNTTLSFNGVASSITSYNWNCDGCSNLINPGIQGPHSVFWNVAGLKTVSLTLNTPGCSPATATATVTVNTPPTSTFTAAPSPACVADNVTLAFTGTPGATYTWNCDGCNQNPTTAGPHSVSWINAGIKTITLTVTSPGCPPSAVTSMMVTINAQPTSTFTASPSPSCVGAPTTLTHQGTPGQTYNWNCDGCQGLTSNTSGPHQVSWATPGTKSLSLTVSSPGCPPSVPASLIVVVNQQQVAITASQNPICHSQNTTLTFAGAASSGATYNWNCNGCSGIVSTTTLGPHTVSWGTAGVKTVTLSVSTPGCAPEVATVLVTVNQQPTSDFNISSTPICQGLEAQLTFTGVPGATYTWNCGGCIGAPPTTQGPHSVSWTTAGTKTLSLTVVSPGCPPSAPSTVTIQVNPLPTANFSLSNALTCIQAPISVNFIGTPGSVYNWNCGGCVGGNPITVGPHNFSWNTAGEKTIKLTVEQVGCPSASFSATITVNPAPVAIITASQSTTCVESAVNFASTGSVGEYYTWSCDGCNGVAPNSAGPQTLSWLTPGTKTLSLSVANAGCSAPAIQQFTLVVTPIPIANFAFSANPVCINQTATLTFTGSGATTFNWNCDGCQGLTPNTSGPHTVSWNAPGLKTVSLTISAVGCPPSTFSQILSVNGLPVANFDPNINPTCQNAPTVLSFSGTAAPGAVYTWNCDGCGQSLSGPGPHSVSWSSLGVRTVTLTVQNLGCAQTATATQLITVNQQPVAAFTINPLTLCAGATAVATFTGTPGQVYNWNCDGCTQTPTGPGPHNLVWATTGNKTVSLNVTTPGCPVSNTASQVITINLNTSTFQLSKTNACVNEPLTLSFTGTPGNIYTWNCDGCNETPTTVGPHRIHWSGEGVKTLTLQVSSSGCVSEITSLLVTINPNPVSDFTATSSVCVGENAALEFTGVPGNDPTTYSWSCDGCDEGVPQTIGPHSVKWSLAGNKTVRLTIISNGCASNVASRVVTVYPRPVANFSASGPVCVGATSTLRFTGSLGAPPHIFTWDCDNCQQGLLSGQGPHTASWSSEGVKTLTLNVSSNGCPAQAPATVLITVLETPTSAFTASQLALCANNSGNNTFTELTYIGSAQGNPVYTWNCDNCEGGVAATVGPHRVSWSTAGVKTLTLRVGNTGVNTCVSPPTSLLVTVNPTPTSAFTASAIDICAGASTTLTFSGSAQAGANYNWDCGGCVNASLTGQGPHAVSWATAGQKTITLKVENPAPTACSSGVTSVLVNVRPSPLAPNPRSNSPACAGGVLTLTADPTPGATYQWRGPGGWSATRATATRSSLTASAAGVYTVTVTLGACSVTATAAVTVNSPPAAPNPTSDSPVCENGLLNLTAASSANAEYQWSGPAGFTSDLQNPSIAGGDLTAANTGIYTVTVTTPGCAPRVGFVTVQVNQAPLPPNPPATLQLCTGNTLSLTATGSPDATYLWSGPNGYVSTELAPVRNNITTAMAGLYVLQVSVPGCPEEVGVTNVTINQSPNPPRLQHNGPICQGQELRLTAAATPGATYSWIGPNNFSSAQNNVSIAAATSQASGLYSFQVTLGNCTLSDTATVTVNVAPVAPIIVANTPPICAGSTLSFTVTNPTAGANYAWSGPDGWSSTTRDAQRPNASPLASGVYTLVASSGGCPSASSTISVTINPQPATPILAPIAPICSGEAIRLAITNPSAGVTYNWSGPAGFASTLQNPTILNATTSHAGAYTVIAAAQGCSASATIDVAVNAPAPAPVVASNSPLCIGQDLSLTFSNPASGVSYHWQGPGLASATTELNPTITNAQASAAGVYTLTARVAGCPERQATVSVVINRLPGTPNAAALERCQGEPFTFTATMGAPAGNEIRLYDASQQIVASDNTPPSYLLTAGNLTATATYYLTAFNSLTGCESEKRQVLARVNPQPPAPTAFAAARCNPGMVTFMPEVAGEPSGVGVRIFDVNGVLIDSDVDAPYELSAYIASTSTFYLESYFLASGCVSPVRTAVTASILEQPLPPGNLSARRCGPGSVTLSATMGVPPGAEILIFSDPVSSTPLVSRIGPGNLPPISVSSNVTYYAAISMDGCLSELSEVYIDIHPIPGAPIVRDTTLCGGGAAQLNVQLRGASANRVNLYSTSMGGSVLASAVTQPFTLSLPNVSSSVTYFVESENTATGCKSSRSPVRINVRSAPDSPIVALVNRPSCGGGAVRILAEMGENRGNVISLYTVAVGGAPIATVNGAPYEFTIPSVTTHTTFYLESLNTATGCRSARAAIPISVPGALAPPVVNSTSICGSGVATFTGAFSPIGAEIRLYTQAAGGSPIASDFNSPYRLTTPVISATATFYISIFSDGCESARVPVTAVVHPIPAEPTVRNVARCGSGSVTFTAIMNEPAGAFIGLYAQATEGSDPALVSALSAPYQLTTPILTETTTYYVGSVNDVTGCRSARVSVVAAIHPIPGAPVLTDSTVARCGPGVVNFSVQMSEPAGNTAVLYRQQCGGSPLAQDNTPPYVLSTPLLNQTTDFFIAVRDANTGCQSACRLVKASIIDVSTRLSAANNGPVCAGSNASVTFTASGAAGATAYLWSGPGGFSVSTSSPTLTRNGLTLSDAGNYSVVAIISGCSSAAATTLLEVRPTPPAPVPMCYSCSPSSPNSICAGQNLTLGLTPASFSNYAPGTNFIWSAIAYNASTSAREITRPSANESFSGVYSLVAAAGGCTSGVVTLDIAVASSPSVPSATNNGPFCAGSARAVKLYASGAGSGVTYHWSGPNRFSAVGDSVAVSSSVANAGVYTVVAVNSVGCSSTVATTILSVVAATPVPRITANSPVCQGQELVLSVIEPIAGVDYIWTGPAGFNQSGSLVRRSETQLSHSGTYSVTARASDCPSAVATVEVIVNAIPSPPSTTGSINVCAGAPLSLAVTGGVKESYYWQGPAGFVSTLASPTITSARELNAGVYSVVAISNGCSSMPAIVEVEVIRAAPPLAASNSPLCEGQNLRLSAQSDLPNASFYWQGPLRFVSESSNPVITGISGSMAGAYSVVTISNGCTSAPAVINVTVNPAPATPTIATNSPLCAGSTLQLSASLHSGFGYQWSGPAGFSSAQRNPNIANVSESNAGIYSLILVAGSCSSDIATVAVSISSVSATLLGRDTSVCAGARYALPMRLSGTGPWEITYTVGSQRFTHSATAPSGNDAVISIPLTVRESAVIRINSVVDAAGCASGNIPGAVNLTALPAPQATLRNPTLLLCNGSSGELILDITGGDSPWNLGWSVNGVAQPTELAVASPVRIQVSPSVTTTYAFTSIAGARGCATALNLQAVATVIEPPRASVATSSVAVCAGASAQIPVTVEAPLGSAWRLHYRLGGENFTLTGNGPGRVALTTPAINDTSLLQLTSIINTSVSSCSTALSTNINLVPVRPRLSANTEPASCSGGGSISALATGGAQPYTFTLTGTASQSNNTGNFFNLPAGNYSVRVIDGNGCEAVLGNVSVAGIAAPAILSITTSCSTATVSWENLGSLVQAYNVRFRVIGSANWAQISNLTEASVVLTGLQANAQYEVQTQLICNRQNSVWSSSRNFTTTCEASQSCQAPEGVAIQAGATSLQISWLAVQGALSYVVEYRLAGNTSWQSLAASGSPFRITGLSANTAYEVRVIANCQSGLSTPSAISRATTTQSCETLPLSITGGATGCGSLLLAPSIADLPGLSYTWKFNGVTVSNSREYRATFSGIYQLEVRQGSCPAQVASQRVTISGNAPGVSATPTAASCSTCADGSILVTILSGSGPFEYTLGDPVNGPYQTSNTFSGLAPGNYTVNVRTVGSSCTASVVITVGVLPAAPRIVSATSTRSNSATVVWEAVPGITSYNIQYRPLGQTSWLQASNLTGTSTTLLGLSAGTSYQVRIQGITSGGQLTAWSGIYLEPVSFTTPANKQEVLVEKSGFDLMVYPNPTQGRLALNFRVENNTIVRCFIIDGGGRVVYNLETIATAGERAWDLELDHLPAGLYLLTLQAGELKEQIKLVKY